MVAIVVASLSSPQRAATQALIFYLLVRWIQAGIGLKETGHKSCLPNRERSPGHKLR